MPRHNLQQFLSINQALTSIGTTISTNSFDTQASRDMAGFKIPMEVYVGTRFTSAGAATLTVRITTSADNSTFTDLVKTKTYALSELTAGAKLYNTQSLPQGCKRYVRVEYDIATAAMTAGTIFADLPASVEGGDQVAGVGLWQG